MTRPHLHAASLVCLVEDDAAVRHALTFALELEGFAVEAYASGEDLLRRESDARPACLVLDERLPGLSGLETLRALRATDADIPAILVTSHPRSRFRAEAAQAGVPILEKPLLGDMLAGVIHRLTRAVDPAQGDRPHDA